MAEHTTTCPVCACPVCIVSTDEGTSHYKPLTDQARRAESAEGKAYNLQQNIRAILTTRSQELERLKAAEATVQAHQARVEEARGHLDAAREMLDDCAAAMERRGLLPALAVNSRKAIEHALRILQAEGGQEVQRHD